jgi:NTE family protein
MSRQNGSIPTVAVACQGGGSHTAFTAGVLDRLLAEEDFEFDIVELSGTSGGAICAFTTWFGLASSPPADASSEARRLLTQVWNDITATGLAETTANTVAVGLARAQSRGVPLPAVGPYDTPVADWSREILREVLEEAIAPDELRTLVERSGTPPPRLEIGAVDLQRGSFRTFTERTVTHDAVLASAAVPPLFKPAPVTEPNGTVRWFWDGLFSQNPPLGDLFGNPEGRQERADEFWIVQINPRREERLPRRLDEIADRRNELGGNLSVNQELRFIRLLNQWRAEGRLDDSYRPIEVKTIDLDETLVSPTRPLDYATKLDRSPQFIQRLWEHGAEQADRFLTTERERQLVTETVTETWSGSNATAAAECVTPDFRVHFPTSLAELGAYLDDDPEVPASTLDRNTYATVVETFRRAFPDLQFDIEESVVESGKAALRWRATGTHTEPLLDIEPTGRPVTLSGTGLYHLDGGQVAEAWVLTDQWGLLRQLEAVESPAALPTATRVGATPVVTQLTAPVENERLARIEIEDVWTRGRREGLDRILAENHVLHLDDGTDARGTDGYWELVKRYRDAFPDLTIRLEETVSEGDKIVLRQTLRGTHGRSFLNIPPTDGHIEIDRLTIHHVDDGRIVETGIVDDIVRLLHQLD